jgi:predicted metalloprotease with PDZ domain
MSKPTSAHTKFGTSKSASTRTKTPQTTTKISGKKSSSAHRLAFHYQVAMPNPESHLFEVTFTITGWQSTQLDLKMPAWTPGSYLVREYVRHVQDWSVEADGQPLPFQKLAKNHWHIQTQGASTVTVTYRVFANELSVRTNHLDATHGYFNGAALFFYVPGFEDFPWQVTIAPPQPDWQVTTTLEAIAPNTFEAPDFDTLVDSPFEIGTHQVYDFDVLGKPHQLAIWGEGNADLEQVIIDTQKLIETEAQLFEGLPYERYLFLLHLSAQGYGGLEHKDSCSLNYPRLGFRGDRYQRYLQLVAHEFFHLWNVKRIRPKALEVFDYDAENYTPSLWFSEGTTSYYDLTIPFRAGLYDAKTYLQELSKEVTRFLTTPGRRVQTLSESSFDAWIKLYRRDANSDNNQISYYLKGEMVSFLLDLRIRQQHQSGRSLDDVLRLMWHQFGEPEIGFTPEELEEIIESVAAQDLKDFFQRYLHQTDELPFDEYLQPFGLKLRADDPGEQVAFTGMTLSMESGSTVVKFVETGSPAQKAGLDSGDELLALDGWRVNAEQWGDRLKDYAPGDSVEVTFFHQDELQTGTLVLQEPRPTRYQIVPVENPNPHQKEQLKAWLGVMLEDLSF